MQKINDLLENQISFDDYTSAYGEVKVENLQKQESIESESEPEESSDEIIKIKEVKSESSDEETG